MVDLQKENEKCTSNNSIIQAVIKSMKAAVQTMWEAGDPNKGNSIEITTASTSTRGSRPALKLTFNWMAKEKYNELLHFEMEVKVYIHDHEPWYMWQLASPSNHELAMT